MTNKCFYENTGMFIKFGKNVVIWYDIIGNGDLFYQWVYMCACLWMILLWNVLMLNNVYIFLKILTNID